MHRFSSFLRRDVGAAGRGDSTRRLGVAPFAVAAVVGAIAVSGCVSTASFVQTEATSWGAFAQVIDGPLDAGVNQLPAPVREAHCYRVILASEGTMGAPLLRFAGDIDSDSVGFPIISVPMRGTAPGNGTVSVFGFCSQGTGTVQLLANLPSRGHGAMYEAPFGSLDPSQGPDVAAVRSWLARRQQEEARRRAQQQEQQRREAMQRFAQEAGSELRTRLDELTRPLGRYSQIVLDEVRSAPEMQEALVLEPGLCYVFGVLPHQNTQVRADVTFSRIRNATQRTDSEGAILYTVCTAPSGPVQEVSFTVQSRSVPNAPTPPAFAVRVASRPASSSERRAADQEWLRNDPEARISQ